MNRGPVLQRADARRRQVLATHQNGRGDKGGQGALTISCSSTLPSLVSLMSPEPDTSLRGGGRGEGRGGEERRSPQGPGPAPPPTTASPPRAPPARPRAHIFMVPLGPRLVRSTSCSPRAALMFTASAACARATSALGFSDFTAAMMQPPHCPSPAPRARDGGIRRAGHAPSRTLRRPAIGCAALPAVPLASRPVAPLRGTRPAGEGRWERLICKAPHAYANRHAVAPH